MSAIRKTGDRKHNRVAAASPYSRKSAPAVKKGWSIGSIFSYLNPLKSRSQQDELVAGKPYVARPVEIEDDDEASFEPYGHVNDESYGGDGPSEDEVANQLMREEPERGPSSAAQALANRGRQLAGSLNGHGPPPQRTMYGAPPKTPNVNAAQFSFARSPAPSPRVPGSQALHFATPATLPRRGKPLTVAEPLIREKEILERDVQMRAPETPPRAAFTFQSPSRESPNNMVANYMREKQSRGETLDVTEMAAIVDLLRNQEEVEPERERFRLSASAEPTTPHGQSPATPRTLTKNPNPPLKWTGGGSSRTPSKSRLPVGSRQSTGSATRNRYSSAAFGAKPAPPGLKINEPANIRADTKRRRVEESVEDSASESTGPSPSMPNFPFPVSNGTPSPPASSSEKLRSRVSAPKLTIPPKIVKPTNPSVPSPLRQAWGQTSEPSSRKSSTTDVPMISPSTSVRRGPETTKAADFMTSLINDVTPPKKPDLSNPYQTASPVRLPPTKRIVKRPRASVVAVPSKEKEEKEGSPEKKQKLNKEEKKPKTEYTQQAIIEASLPKGSKRSRPPPSFGMKPNTASGTSTIGLGQPPPRPSRVTVEEVSDEDDVPSKAAPKAKELTPEDVDMTAPKAPFASEADAGSLAAAGSRPSFGSKSNLPKEPSKLRFSYAPSPPSGGKAPSPAVPSALASAQPLFSKDKMKVDTPAPAPAKPAFAVPGFSKAVSAPVPPPTFVPVVAAAPAVPKPAPFAPISNAPKDPKSAALALPVHSLPVYTFTTVGESSKVKVEHLKARDDAAALSSSSLPKFTIVAGITAPKPAGSVSNWAASGYKAPTAGNKWKCGTCMVSNDESAEKCVSCTEPKPKAAATPAPSSGGGGGWAAAGWKAPDLTAKWTCGVCMVSNDESKDKCVSCTTDKPVGGG